MKKITCLNIYFVLVYLLVNVLNVSNVVRKASLSKICLAIFKKCIDICWLTFVKRQNSIHLNFCQEQLHVYFFKWILHSPWRDFANRKWLYIQGFRRKRMTSNFFTCFMKFLTICYKRSCRMTYSAKLVTSVRIEMNNIANWTLYFNSNTQNRYNSIKSSIHGIL